jgi:hypothetical protein
MNKMDQKFNENETRHFLFMLSASRDSLSRCPTSNLITNGKLLHLDQSATCRQKRNGRDICVNRLTLQWIIFNFRRLPRHSYLIIYIYRRQMQVCRAKFYK